MRLQLETEIEMKNSRSHLKVNLSSTILLKLLRSIQFQKSTVQLKDAPFRGTQALQRTL